MLVAGVQVAALTANASQAALPAQSSDSSQFELLLDPNEMESDFSDMLLQVVGTQLGITGLHVDSVQRGGIRLEVLSSAVALGWHGLQVQHHHMQPCIDQVRPSHDHSPSGSKGLLSSSIYLYNMSEFGCKGDCISGFLR